MGRDHNSYCAIELGLRLGIEYGEEKRDDLQLTCVAGFLASLAGLDIGFSENAC